MSSSTNLIFLRIFGRDEKRAKPYADKENAIVMNLKQFTDDRF